MSVARRFRVVDGEVREVTDNAPASTLTNPMPMIASAYSDAKPLKSIAMSIHPEQAGMLNEQMRSRGIQGVQWDERTGDCLITSRRGRAQAMPVFGKLVRMDNVHDDDGGYGDG